MRFLRARSGEAELMDGRDTPCDEYRHCLQSLEWINRLSFAYAPTLRWLRPLLAEAERPLHIVDIACGGGDMLRRIEGRARRWRRVVRLTGVDLDPMAKRVAEELTARDSAIRYVTADIFAYEPDAEIDIAICALFTHHLTEAEIVRFLRWLDTTPRRGWLISDLHRHALPYYFIAAATALFSRNRLIRHDAPLSVARGFTKRDWQRMLPKAGLVHDVRIRWVFPFRWCVQCVKT